MAVTSSPSPALLATTAPLPPAISGSGRTASLSVRVSPQAIPGLPHLHLRGNQRSTRPKAGLTEIEPDLEEDKHDPWRTNGVEPEDFEYGVYDGHHTYQEEVSQESFWELVAKEYQDMEPPTGFQGVISWLFLPAVYASLAYNLPGEYLYIGAGIFVVIFCAIEMGKPDKPHNFEPQIYNMDRKARDKLIEEYNTMDIWDFNEKYGELWDFTVKRDDIIEKLKA